jgi:4-hydroxy-3-polyprenylbenzoate decarboxylase
MGQMMFTKYIIVVDDDVDVHNTSEVLFRLCANTDPQRDSIFTKGPSDVLDHATSEIASGSKLGIDATKKIAGEGFKRAWPPLIKMDEGVKARVDKMLKGIPSRGVDPHRLESRAPESRRPSPEV